MDYVNWPSAITSVCGVVVGVLTYLKTRRIDTASIKNEDALQINTKITRDTSILLKAQADLITAKFELEGKSKSEINQIHQAEIILLNEEQKKRNANRLALNLNERTSYNKVLVVEDNKIDAELFCETLAQVNLKGTVAKDSVEVVSLMTKTKYDAAFIDLNLPGSLNGYDLLKIMTIVNSDIPLFVVTGYCDERITKAIKLLGAMAILQKPVTVEALRYLLQSLKLN